jgi:hypothetical protein
LIKLMENKESEQHNTLRKPRSQHNFKPYHITKISTNRMFGIATTP